MDTELYLALRDEFRAALNKRQLLNTLSKLEKMNEASEQKVATEHLVTLREHYVLLLSNLRQGRPDPTRSEQLGRLFARCYELGEQLHRNYVLRHTRQQRASVFRTLECMHDVPSQLEVFRGNHSQRMLFEVVWTGAAWSANERRAAHDFLGMSRIAEGEKLMLIAAVMLSLLASFDGERFAFLIDLIDAQWEADSLISRRMADRAHVALVFAVMQHSEAISLYPQLEDEVRRLSRDERLAQRWMQLQRILLHSKHTAVLTQQLENEILPEIAQFSGGAQLGDRFDFSHIEQFAPSDPNAVDAKRLQELFSMLLELQQSGADITYGSFRQVIQQLPFFKTAAHWFAHFTMRHPEVSRVQAHREEWKQILESKNNDTDRFAFVKYLEAMTTSGRGQAVESADILMRMTQRRAAEEEYSPEEIVAESDAYLRSFVQDCYRFFKLYVYRNEEEDPFLKSVLLTDYQILSAPFSTIESREAVIEFCHILEDYVCAERLLASLPADFERLKRRAICFQKMGLPMKAIPLYERALVMEDRLDIVRALADCHLQLNEYNDALTYLIRLEIVAPDDTALLLQISSCMLRLGLCEEALERLHKVDYLQPQLTDVARQKAWAFFLTERYDEAIGSYDRVLADNPTAEDYRYSAHCHWIGGDLPSAAVLYAESLQRAGLSSADEDFFAADEALLKQHGLRAVDLRLMIDLLNSGV